MSYSFTVIYLSLGFVFPLFKSSKEWNNVIIYLGGKKKRQNPYTYFSLFKCCIIVYSYYLQKYKKNFFQIPIKFYIFYDTEHYRNTHITKHTLYIKSQEAFFSPAG